MKNSFEFCLISSTKYLHSKIKTNKIFIRIQKSLIIIISCKVVEKTREVRHFNWWNIYGVLSDTFLFHLVLFRVTNFSLTVMTPNELLQKYIFIGKSILLKLNFYLFYVIERTSTCRGNAQNHFKRNIHAVYTWCNEKKRSSLRDCFRLFLSKLLATFVKNKLRNFKVQKIYIPNCTNFHMNPYKDTDKLRSQSIEFVPHRQCSAAKSLKVKTKT